MPVLRFDIRTINRVFGDVIAHDAVKALRFGAVDRTRQCLRNRLREYTI